MGRQQVDNGYQNCAEIADNAEISEWAKLDLQSIQHRDYFGHLSISLLLQFKKEKWKTDILSLNCDKTTKIQKKWYLISLLWSSADLFSLRTQSIPDVFFLFLTPTLLRWYFFLLLSAVNKFDQFLIKLSTT